MSRMLLATNHLFGWTGSEITIATLASVLHDGGHDVLVYAPFWSRPDADRAFLGGLPATKSLAEVIAFKPEAAYTQHHPVAVAVRAALPACPIVHAVLGVLPYLEQPPGLSLGIHRFLAISEETRDALLGSGLEQQQISLFRNLVDDRLFTPGDNPLPTRPQTVACYSYKLEAADLQALQAAATAQGLNLRTDTNTQPGNTPYGDAPGRVRSGEIVVASGRGAIEAMLCGRVPLIMANCGDDGLVTPANFKDLMRTNFSGRSRGGKMSAAQVAAQIASYRADDAAELRQLALRHFGVSRRRQNLLDLFGTLPRHKPEALAAQQTAAIAFEAEGLKLQREFATLAAHSLQRAKAAAGASPVSGADDNAIPWPEQVNQGSAAWKGGDVWKALDLFVSASRGHVAPAPMRSLVSLVLVELAERERRDGSKEGRRRALEAFLRINPGQAWAHAQLAECASSESDLS